MILFIFEGEDREPHIYKTLERLYFPKKNDNIICSFGNNIYELYRQMMEYGEDADIVGLMKELLELFNDETNHGKLYINYPMIESLRYTKELPDENFKSYAVSRKECVDFKRLTHEFSFYNNFDHLLFKDGEKPTKVRYITIRDNWDILIRMNVMKANWMISGSYKMPENKEEVRQSVIFDSQIRSYVEPHEFVAVLNSFPLFLFEYFKIKKSRC